MVNSKETKRLRTARLVVSAVATETLTIINLLKHLSGIFNKHHEDYLAALKNHNLRGFDKKINIELDPVELGKINGALRDYITLRIANLVDSHPAALSLKDFDGIDLEKIKKIPQVQEILQARDNWIGHVNKRFIGPVDKGIFFDEKIIDLLNEIVFLVCTQTVQEKKKQHEK